MYTDKIVPAKAEGGSDSTYMNYVELYLLADKLQDLTTANLVADQILLVSEQTNKSPDYAEIAHAYSHTTPGHPLRRLMRDFRIQYGGVNARGVPKLTGEGMAEALYDICEEFARLTVHQNKRFFYPYPHKQPKCHYHLGASGVRGEECRREVEWSRVEVKENACIGASGLMFAKYVDWVYL